MLSLKLTIVGALSGVGQFLFAQEQSGRGNEPTAAPRSITLQPPDATLSEEFAVIGSLRELSDGRVLITDERENRIVVADFVSGVVQPVGRRGRGPGEYEQVSRLWAIGGDSSVMADRFSRRWLFFDGSRIVSTLSSDAAAIRMIGPGLIQGADRFGRIVAKVYSRGRSGATAFEDSMLVVRFNPALQNLDSIARVPSEFAVGRASYGARPGDQVAVFPDGWVAIARVNPYGVEWCSPSGKCTAGPAPLAPARSMRDIDKRAYLRIATRTTHWPPTSDLEETTGWPEIVPPFIMPEGRLDGSALVAAPDGRLLIKRLAIAEAPHPRYDLIARNGAIVGEIVLPADQHIVAFGAKSVYVAVTNDDGIQRLSRHPW
jgi:hypothetical protein